MTVSVTVASFRGHYPEFADGNIFANSAVGYWLALASKLLNADRWGTLIDLGAELFIAHNLALEAKNQAEAASGAIPGGQVGVINNKSVDKVSVGYDTSAGIEPNAGHWNLTNYGTRFISLANMAGSGPMQIGVPNCGSSITGGAWSGPWQSQWPNQS